MQKKWFGLSLTYIGLAMVIFLFMADRYGITITFGLPLEYQRLARSDFNTIGLILIAIGRGRANTALTLVPEKLRMLFTSGPASRPPEDQPQEKDTQ